MKGRTLIVGGSGFVGRHCVNAFSGGGYDVHATFFRASVPLSESVQWHCLDIFDRRSVDELIADIKPDYLVDCAWFVKHKEFWESPLNQAYTEATVNLYESFSRYGKKTVFFGTGAETFSAVGQGSDTAYAKAKIKTSENLAEIRSKGGAPYIWARLYGLYGEGEPAQKLVPYIVTSYLSNVVPVIKNPRMFYDFTYARNLGALVKTLLSGTQEHLVDCTTGHVLSLMEFADYIHTNFFPDHPKPIFENLHQENQYFLPSGRYPVQKADTSNLIDFQTSMKSYTSFLRKNHHEM